MAGRRPGNSQPKKGGSGTHRNMHSGAKGHQRRKND
jgi:hypothetical protein